MLTLVASDALVGGATQGRKLIHASNETEPEDKDDHYKRVSSENQKI